MGSSQSQTNQVSHNPQSNPHLDCLLKSQSTVAHFIQSQPDPVSHSIKCPRCQQPQFDDGLGCKVNCFNCRLVYFVIDGIINISSEEIHDAQRAQPIREPQLQNLTSVVFQVNQATIPQELIIDGKTDYSRLVNHVILPFFTIRQRAVTLGYQFKIGYFEFRSVGGHPELGLVSKDTEIYCYDCYSNQTIRKMRVYSQRQSSQVEQEIKTFVFANPSQNQIIQDSYVRVNNTDLLVLQSDKKSGKLSNLTRIECVADVQRLKCVKFWCMRMPQEFRQLSQMNENAKHAIVKTVLVPYFTGLTRYLERGQMIQIADFEFTAYFPEDFGLVVPFQTQLELEVRPRQEQVVRPQQQQPDVQSQRIQQMFMQRRADLQRQHLQQIEALHRLLNTFILLNENPTMFYQSNGASQEMIDRLPVRQIDIQFLRSKQLDEDHIRCMICLSDYEDLEAIRTMPCLHYFHQECLDSWLVKNKTCPVCKTDCDES